MKLHLETNIAEGTPEELVAYLRLVEEGKKTKLPLFSFGHAHQPDEDTLKSLVGSLVKMTDSYTGSTKLSVDEAVDEAIEEEEAEPPTELKVGDKVKVLESLSGAVGEATVTAILEDGEVEIAGKNIDGTYLTNWRNNAINLEKIEEEADELLGYRYWYLEGTNFNKFVVLESSPEGYFEDSTGKRYTHNAVSKHVKPIDREDAYVKFEDAEDRRALLKYFPTVDMFDKVY